MRRHVLTAAFGVLAAIAAAPATPAGDPDEALLARPARVELPGPAADVALLQKLAIGVTARPHVQRPAAAAAPQQVLRPGRGALRAPLRD